MADRIRPRTIGEVVGQEHLTAEDAPLRQFFESGDFPSMIFWGPPGVGKTTFAMLIADRKDYDFIRISAIESGVKEVRQIISRADSARKAGRRTLLFIDEIHRFNKSQQDALLHAVEKGVITLVGATTENPSFEVNSALLSRCQVYRLQYLNDDDIRRVVERALSEDEILKEMDIEIEDWDFLIQISGGDARTALNALELSQKVAPKHDGKVRIERRHFEKALQRKTGRYDKKGDNHYDTISAFIKSLRGSDPDASLFWMAKMLDAGEDPLFIARRMVIFASEDVGNADPVGLMLAVNVFQACHMIGMPEARINLAQACTYLASCPKSNASYKGIEAAMSDVAGGAPVTVPLHIRNAPTELMKKEGYHEGYKYPHSYPGHFVVENYFPEGMQPKVYYKPTEIGREKAIRERLHAMWKGRYPSED
ncbi:MAG: replication-associated recombination protein A [Bacteroidota bacterium]